MDPGFYPAVAAIKAGNLEDRKSTRLNSSHVRTSYAVFCLKKKNSDQHLLPSSQPSRPIDIDLLNHILRLPYRQRLTIILHELRPGLAGRRAALHPGRLHAD